MNIDFDLLKVNRESEQLTQETCEKSAGILEDMTHYFYFHLPYSSFVED